MRIVVWNCRMKLASKLTPLLALKPDIAIVPEAAATLPDEALTASGLTYEWVGSNPNKGLGVLGRHPYRVAPSWEDPARLEWILPLTVEGPNRFALLAVWAMNHRASNRGPSEAKLRQVDRAIEAYEDRLGSPLVVAGDFNNAVLWDNVRNPAAPGNFAVTASRLSALGLVSAYHAVRRVPFGEESEPTLYWQTQASGGRTYHIDYCFLPAQWSASIQVSIGSYDDWIASGLSDHAPLVVDVPSELEKAARAAV